MGVGLGDLETDDSESERCGSDREKKEQSRESAESAASFEIDAGDESDTGREKSRCNRASARERRKRRDEYAREERKEQGIKSSVAHADSLADGDEEKMNLKSKSYGGRVVRNEHF